MIPTVGQLQQLSELTLDIAKALFIASFATPFLASRVDMFLAVKSFALATFFTAVSLGLMQRKEEYDRA